MNFFRQGTVAVFHSGAIRQSLAVLVGNTAAAFVSAVSMIYASRVLGPELFGVLSVSTSMMLLLIAISDLGLNTLITRWLAKYLTDLPKAQRFIQHILLWKLILITGVLTTAFLISPLLLPIIKYPYHLLFAIMLSGTLFLAMNDYAGSILSALHQFRTISIITVSQALVRGIWVVAMLLLGVRTGIELIAFGYFFAPLPILIWLWYRYPQWFRLAPKLLENSFQPLLKKYAFHHGVGGIGMAIVNNFDLILVNFFLSPFETGLFAGVTRIALFLSFLSSALSGVLSNRVVRYTSQEMLLRYLKKSLALSLLIMGGFLVYLPLSRYIMLLTIGPEYIPALLTMNILVANAFLSLAVVPFLAFFYAVRHPSYFSLGGVMQASTVLTVSILFLPDYGLVAAAIARLLATVLFIGFTFVYGWYAWRNFSQSDRVI